MAEIAMLAIDCDATRILYHALRARFGRVRLLLEEPRPRVQVARARLRRYGVGMVLGQAVFQLVVHPLLAASSRARRAGILREASLDVSPLPPDTPRVESVNSDEARAWLKREAPAVVVLSGTRIVSRETLAAVDAPILNLHAGITPRYRGVHGGYWALVEGRPEEAGTTLHRVDAGIDTGPVLAQATLDLAEGDSFATYPLLHVRAGLPLLLDAVEHALQGTLPPGEPVVATREGLRSHPTAWGYLWRRWTRHVR